jgi:hypothetical protein
VEATMDGDEATIKRFVVSIISILQNYVCQEADEMKEPAKL